MARLGLTERRELAAILAFANDEDALSDAISDLIVERNELKDKLYGLQERVNELEQA
jgi:hypothetical protein